MCHIYCKSKLSNSVAHAKNGIWSIRASIKVSRMNRASSNVPENEFWTLNGDQKNPGCHPSKGEE